MPHYPDEDITCTRENLLQALADELGAPADDPRILDAYDQIVGEWALHAPDPDAEYARYFLDGPVATRIDLVLAREWASGRILL